MGQHGADPAGPTAQQRQVLASPDSEAADPAAREHGIPTLHNRGFNPADTGAPLEISTIAAMRARSGDEVFERLGRVFFHVVIICTAGEGLHEVDFVPTLLEPGRIIHVQPGQVHRWRFAREYKATCVLFEKTPDTLIADGWPNGPRSFKIDHHDWDYAQRVIELARAELIEHRDPPRQRLALDAVLQLLVVALGLDLTHRPDRSHLPPPYVRLIDQLETDHGWSRSVNDHAERLGYSQRTLTRACTAAIGKTAKQVIDERIAFEARRLMVEDHQTIDAISRELGFTEASNFTKFFQRVTGDTPESWRARHRL